MTLSEFKAWFEGFSENIEDVPTKEQWDKIKVKMLALGSPAVLDPSPFVPSPLTRRPYPGEIVGPYWTNPNITCSNTTSLKD